MEGPTSPKLPSSDAAGPVRILAGSLILVVLAGCATALKRESKCLASMTPDVMLAHEELANLEASWHEALIRRDIAFNTPAPAFAGVDRQPARRSTPSAGVISAAFGGEANESPQQAEARRVAADAYEKLMEARAKHRPFVGMYDKVYERVRTRMEEEDILSEVRMVLLAGPASLIFYPLIRWNVHTVLWDGHDPDAENDAITRFCRDRLVQEVAFAERMAKAGGTPETTGANRPIGGILGGMPRDRAALAPGL